MSFGQPMSALVSSANIVRPVPRKPLTPELAKRTPTVAPNKDLTLSQLNAGLGKDSSPATSEKFIMRPFTLPEGEELECEEKQMQVDASQRLELTEVNENGKRKRKTERELYLLRTELRKNAMWTRESIKKLRARHAKDFYMSEQQIYKWWWDQTRKRTRKGVENAQQAQDTVVSFQDEFGGYSSRLRVKGSENDTLGDNVELSLCDLLGIDVDKLALMIVQGKDPWAANKDPATAESSAVKGDDEA